VEFRVSPIPGRFVERRNRFLAAVDCGEGRVEAHLPNTGRLREILVPGRPVYLAPIHHPKRKTRFSLILADLPTGLVSLDSGAPNIVAAEYFSSGAFIPFTGYETVRREVGRFGSRYDLVLSGAERPELIVEIKGVTLVRGGRAFFPDAPTARGTRHIEGLIEARSRGIRAAVVFLVMRSDAESFSPNTENDAAFAGALERAGKAGVEVYALTCRVTTRGIRVERRIDAVPRT
jgi:sugar fermentation stimulation protein A